MPFFVVEIKESRFVLVEAESSDEATTLANTNSNAYNNKHDDTIVHEEYENAADAHVEHDIDEDLTGDN